jgi:DUF177 domain-containing protein
MIDVSAWRQAPAEAAMLLDLRGFRGTQDHIERREHGADVAHKDEDLRLSGPVDFAADVHKDHEKVRLKGRVRGTLALDCSRCLEPYSLPADAAFDVLFLPASSNVGESEREVQEDDVGVSYYKDDVIDLNDVMREQFYLAMPMKPLCREDCRGLCPVCGVNRNRETCTCESTWTDPRLEPLRALKKS